MAPRGASQWAEIGIAQPIFHFAIDLHAIIADMDRPFITASDYIATLLTSQKCKLLLIELNPVGMLWFDQPFASRTCLRKAMQQLHTSRSSRNRIKNPAG
jgi:hypothetical protein